MNYVLFVGKKVFPSPENVVDADYAMWPWGSSVVDHSRIALHPDPSAVFSQEPVVLSGDLAFVKHCMGNKERRKNTINQLGK